MSRIADRGLIADSGMQIDVPLQPAANGISPSIDPMSLLNPRSAIRNPQSIELHIEELVLHGFAPDDRHRIADAIESELAALFMDRDVPRPLMQSGEFAALDAGAFHVASNAKAGAIGGQVARAVYGGLIR